MPPWAQRLEERRPVLRFSSNTDNPSGNSKQVIKPAAPAPTTTTSQGPGSMASSGREGSIQAVKKSRRLVRRLSVDGLIVA